MNKQEPMEKEEFQATQDSAEPAEPVELIEPAEPLPDDHYLHDHDGLVEPKVKEYVPLEVGIVIFAIAVLGLIFFGIITDMWGLIG